MSFNQKTVAYVLYWMIGSGWNDWSPKNTTQEMSLRFKVIIISGICKKECLLPEIQSNFVRQIGSTIPNLQADLNSLIEKPSKNLTPSTQAQKLYLCRAWEVNRQFGNFRIMQMVGFTIQFPVRLLIVL